MEIYKDRRYMIINYSEINSVDFNEILQTNKEELRLSIDGTLTVVKWNGIKIPDSISLLSIKYGPYTHDEIIQIMSNSDWTEDSANITGESGTNGTSRI